MSGTDGHQGNVLAHTYVGKINRLILVMNRLERLHEGSSVKKTDFEIIDADKKNPTTLTLKPVPRVRDYNPAPAVYWSIAQLETIDRGEEPDQRIPSAVLGEIAEMAAPSKDDGYKAFWINGHTDPVHFDKDFHVKALSLAQKRAFAETPIVWHSGKAIGEVIGELKKVDDLDADNEVVLVPATGPDFIRCTFPEAMKSEIGKYLFKKVKVKGVLTYDSLSPHPKRVQILDDGISLYPASVSVVKFADLRGIFAGRKRQEVAWDL
ncbi:hypothetical protein [Paragemmobacter ruber]|uniref:Uncharacterized protein n=1 Tax=Paragemmobacter ruber TaxID=1985673 RepID=A0ABW9Y6C1_9RHOB|nr:hypothetical protein [Rhodobacter ruber]NBE08116.1 hypothetical protein [Rhodobacter ruber]